jgi:CubicO group peptidase (beta-lactamase class C family)
MEPVQDPGRLGFDTRRLGRIADWTARYVDAGKIPGATIAIVRHGEVAYFHTTGRRDVAGALPWTRDTVVRVYSMTKPIASVALMTLYEEARIRLDDPVDAYIPSFADRQVLVPGATRIDQVEPARERMTVRHLLTHRAGLTYAFNPGVLGKGYEEAKVAFNPRSGGLAACVERLSAMPLEFHPGARWHYSVSIDVVGRLVEIVSGKPLDVFLRERIFEPLRMTTTGFAVLAGDVGRFATLYEPDKAGGMKVMETAESSSFREGVVDTLSGGGGLVSTADDYLRFAEMLRRRGELGGERILAPRTVGFMASNQLDGDIAAIGPKTFSETSFEGVGFGLAVSVMLDPAKAGMSGSPGDFGWGGMASTAFWVDPVEDMVVLYLTQLVPSSTYPLRKELRALVYQAMVD